MCVPRAGCTRELGGLGVCVAGCPPELGVRRELGVRCVSAASWVYAGCTFFGILFRLCLHGCGEGLYSQSKLPAVFSPIYSASKCQRFYLKFKLCIILNSLCVIYKSLIHLGCSKCGLTIGENVENLEE